MGIKSAKETRIERLKKYLAKRNAEGVVAAAALIGRSPQQTSDLLTGRASFGEKLARSLEERLGLPGLWLDALESEEATYEDEPEDPSFEIPQYHEMGGAMGAGLLLRDQPGTITSWRVSLEWIQKNVPNCTNAGNLAIVTGFGDSMRPLYNPGDPLLVDTGVQAVEFDAIYFFRIGDEGFIKRLQRVPGEGLVAISENKAYRDWFIKEGMDFEVFGRVIKIWRGDDF